MSYIKNMNEIILPDVDFTTVHNRSYRLAAAVFMISNIMDKDEELKTKVKTLSLNLVSMSVNLKDINLLDAKKLIISLEKNSLELMSMLDIASAAGLISKMNGDILREEFQSFLLEIGKFSEKFENDKTVSVKGLFTELAVINADNHRGTINVASESKNVIENDKINNKVNGGENGSRHKRKDLRKNTVLDFIKGHNYVSIKDIVPNITGCSEKTIQRELIQLINEGKIKKTGERRWSRYSII